MSTTNPYLENEVRTATPQKLRVLLLEGAMKFAWQAKQHAEAGKPSMAASSAGRVRSILCELYDGIDGQEDVHEQMRLVYALALTQFMALETSDLVQACERLIGVLQEEVITWREVCAKHPDLPPEVLAARSQNRELTADEAEAILHREQTTTGSSQNLSGEPHVSPGTPTSSFCLDA